MKILALAASAAYSSGGNFSLCPAKSCFTRNCYSRSQLGDRIPSPVSVVQTLECIFGKPKGRFPMETVKATKPSWTATTSHLELCRTSASRQSPPRVLGVCSSGCVEPLRSPLLNALVVLSSLTPVPTPRGMSSILGAHSLRFAVRNVTEHG